MPSTPTSTPSQLAFVREHYDEFVTTAAKRAVGPPAPARPPPRRRGRPAPRPHHRPAYPSRPLPRQQNPRCLRLDLAENQINRQQVMNLFRLQFVEQASNVIFVGGVGLGRIALGHRARTAAPARNATPVLFASAIDVVNTLGRRPGRRPAQTGSQPPHQAARAACSTSSDTSPSTKPAPTCCSRSSAKAIRARLDRHHDQSRLPEMAGNLQQRRHPDFRRPRPTPPPCRNHRHRGQKLQDERRQPRFLTAETTSRKTTTSNRWSHYNFTPLVALWNPWHVIPRH